MKNFIKTFGIIALAAVIGFSMAACGEEEEEGGDGISWEGTWTQIEDASGGTPSSPYSFTLKSDKSWTFGSDNGTEWKIIPEGSSAFAGDSLQLNGIDSTFNTFATIYQFVYEKISNTKIKVTGGTAGATLNGVYEKQ